MPDRWPAFAARESVLADLARARAATPAALDVRFYQASFLRDHGRLDEAAELFEQILTLAPDHVQTLLAYGVVQARRGRRTAARVAFEHAVACDGGDYGALVNLANLLALDEPERAAGLFAAAIAIDPARAEAHRGACSLAAARGDAAAAARHRLAGYAGGAITARPYYGATMPPLALALVSTDGGNIPLDGLLDPHRWLVRELAVEAYRGEALPAGALIFNAIADADRCAQALALAGQIVRAARVPAINAPHAVAATGRVANAARLAALAGVIAPATWFVRDTPDPPVMPAIVRVPGLHMGRGMQLAGDRAAYDAAVAAHAQRHDLIAMQYVDTRAPDGAWRKYRAMIVDGALYPLHLAIGTRWNVHYFSAAMHERADYRAEEAQYLRDPAAAIGAPAWAALERIRDLLGLDYAGIDFALTADGRVVVFEANAAMTVLAPDPDERFAYRRPAADRIRQAIGTMMERALHAASNA